MNISVTEDINGQKYLRVEQELCEGCDYKEWLKGEVEPKTDVLDKIRAEIAEYKDDKVIHDERNVMIDIVLEIIDKYRGKDK